MKPKEVKNIMLQRFMWYNIDSLDKALIATKGCEPQLEISNKADRMIVELSKAIYGKKAKSKETKAVEVPKNWFHHLKKDLGLRYETKDIEVTFDIDLYAIFPDLVGTDHQILLDENSNRF